MTVSAGASGAIFGIYGVFLALLLTNIIDVVQRKALLLSIGVFVAYNLLNGLREGIDNAAHVGGLAAGGRSVDTAGVVATTTNDSLND